MKENFTTNARKYTKIDDFSYSELTLSDDADNYQELEDYLEESFIPKYCHYRKRKIIGIGADVHEDRYPYAIALNKIIALNLNFNQFKFVFYYLDKLGIMVVGYDTELIGEFENYECIKGQNRIDKNIIDSYALTKQETRKLLYDYSKYSDKNDRQSKKIRNRIIEGNLSLVEYVLRSFTFLDMELEDLQSYGYMGLINCIDKYDISLGYEFDTFAISCIKNYITKHLPKILGIKDYGLYREFIYAKTEVERYLQEVYGMKIRISEHPEFLEEVFMIMGLDNKSLNKLDEDARKDKLALKCAINNLYNNFSSELDTIVDTDYDVEEIVDGILLRDIVEDGMQYLSDEKRQILRLRYGLDDYSRAHKEVAELLGRNKEIVRQLSKKAEEILRNSERVKLLCKSYI